MNSSEGLNVLTQNTTTMIINNLQGQGPEGRARTVQSLLSFVGLFIAELLRAIHDAEHGEPVHLTQTNLNVGPGSFAKILKNLQEDFDKMDKMEAIRTARLCADDSWPSLQALAPVGRGALTVRSV